MKKIIILSLLSLVAYTCSGMEKPLEKGKLEELKAAHEETIKARTATAETSGSTSNIAIQVAPSASSDFAETISASSETEQPMLEDPLKAAINALSKRIEKLNKRIELLKLKSPITEIDQDQDYGLVFEWLEQNYKKFISQEAQESAQKALKFLEYYADLYNYAQSAIEENPDKENEINKEMKEEETQLKKLLYEALQQETEANRVLTEKKKSEKLSLTDLENAKRNLEASKSKLLSRPPTPSPTPSSTVSSSSSSSSPSRSGRATPLLRTDEDKFFYAVQKGNTKEVIEWLASKKIKTNIKEPINNRTPLHVAAINGQTAVTYILLEHGADIDRSEHDPNIDEKDAFGATPLIYAIKYKNPETAIMLIYHGNANVNLGDGRHTPLDLVLRIIKQLQNENAPEKVMEVWNYLFNLIRERHGMTRDEMLRQIISASSHSPSSTSPSPTSMLSSPSTSASSLSMLASVPPTESSEQAETIAAPITMRMLPVTIISGPAQEGSMFYPSISSQEPRLDWPSMPVTMEAKTQNLNIQQPIAQQQTAMAQRLEAALATLTTRDAAESKEAKPTQRRS